jgi:transcriptional regulator
MYVHPAFGIGAAAAVAILRERAFGLLVVPAADAPFGVHVPFLVDEMPDGGLRVTLHVARANPIHGHVGSGCKALLACLGPDAYISPDWYGIADQVPTWTYTSVHLTGTARVVPQQDHLAHVDRLSAHFEARLAPKPPWTSAKMQEARRAAMLQAIVVIAMDVDTIEAQNKLNQTKSEAARRGAMVGLRTRGDAGSLAIADLMEATLAPMPPSRS